MKAFMLDSDEEDEERGCRISGKTEE